MRKTLFILFSLVIFILGCAKPHANILPTTDILSADALNAENSVGYDIDIKFYINKNPDTNTDMSIQYPQIKNYSRIDRQEVTNEILKLSAFYNFWNYGSMDNCSIDIECRIVMASERVLSIVFEGLSYVKGNAHPTKHLYAVNIDIQKGEKIILEDVVNSNFWDKLNGDNFKYKNYDQRDIEDSIASGIYDLNGELTFLNLSDYYEYRDPFHYNNFYFTKEKFVIILPTIYAMGGNLEFLSSYDDLRDVMNMDNPIWDRILVAE